MTSISGAQLVARALQNEGIRFTFGIPGAQNLELYDCFDHSADIHPVLVTDERSAPFMAGGLALACGQLGCVLLVPGAGLTHALSGIAEAYMDNVPLLVLATGVRNDIDKSFQLHEIDQLSLARSVTKSQIRVEQAADLYPKVKMACALARTPPAGPVIVEIPANLFIARETGIEALDLTIDCTPAAPALASDTDLQRVAAAIEASQQPLLYLGRGSGGGRDDLVRLAELLEAPVCTTLQGKGVFPEHHPLWLWPGFGPSAPPFVGSIAGRCDLTLAIGCRFSEVATGSYGLIPPGRLIHIDVDPMVIGRNYPASIGIAAEARAFILALLPKLRQRAPNKGLRDRIREGHAQLWSGSGSDLRKDAVSPQRLLTSLQAALPNDTIYVTDSGNGLFLAAEALRLDAPQSFLAPVDFSCMGYAIPTAIGAALGCPGRQVVALEGDGALMMSAFELVTAVHHHLPLLVVVLRDRELGQISQFQRKGFAHEVASILPDYDLAALCAGFGVRHLAVSSNGDIDVAIEAARSLGESGAPVLLEVMIDYSRPTFFSRGVIATNFRRLCWPDRLRFAARVLGRRSQQWRGGRSQPARHVRGRNPACDLHGTRRADQDHLGPAGGTT
jgi:acetolactate synthase-1/2/3 large subunit